MREFFANHEAQPVVAARHVEDDCGIYPHEVIITGMRVSRVCHAGYDATLQPNHCAPAVCILNGLLVAFRVPPGGAKTRDERFEIRRGHAALVVQLKSASEFRKIIHNQHRHLVYD